MSLAWPVKVLTSSSILKDAQPRKSRDTSIDRAVFIGREVGFTVGSVLAFDCRFEAESFDHAGVRVQRIGAFSDKLAVLIANELV